MFGVNTWCKTKTQATNSGQPSDGDPILSLLLLSRHERGEQSLCVSELHGVLVLLVAVGFLLNASHSRVILSELPPGYCYQLNSPKHMNSQ